MQVTLKQYYSKNEWKIEQRDERPGGWGNSLQKQGFLGEQNSYSYSIQVYTIWPGSLEWNYVDGGLVVIVVT